MKITLEHCSYIFIGYLQKAIRKILKRDYPGASAEELYHYMEQELKKFTVNDQFFEFISMPNRFGGNRWFFLCPRCKNKASKLFLPPEQSLLEKKYLCKTCHNLKNQSTVMGQNKMYKHVTRPLIRLKKIQEKLEAGYLNNTTIERLLNEYEQIETTLKKRPEYRLYVFRKQHEVTTA
jgi:hypothetical protein